MLRRERSPLLLGLILCACSASQAEPAATAPETADPASGAAAGVEPETGGSETEELETVEAEPSAEPSGNPTGEPASADAAQLVMATVPAELEVGDPIVVHVRFSTEQTTITVSGEFQQSAQVEAEERSGRPYLSGATLVAGLTEVEERWNVRRRYLRALTEGQGVTQMSSAASFQDDRVSGYSAYVGTDADGTHHAFVDILGQPR